ncbi:MAG: NFACT RNA binding domain-containing protein [Candidatus Nanoarchaeia archaeon]|nr:NFACT RNA binding domain-containing protein [Candidatus Nanoarchaeia archaeon]
MKKLINVDRKYESYRWFYTSGGILAVGGKSDEQNEAVIHNFLRPEYAILHTTEPGSPFIILLSKDPSKKDIEEAGIFCACFSKQWKDGKKEISVDIFKGSQIYKSKLMKTGTFGVKGDKKTIKVKPELVLVIQNGKLRAVPKTTREEKLAEIKQGKLKKEQATEKILKKIKNIYHFPFSKEEVMSAIPSDKLEVR